MKSTLIAIILLIASCTQPDDPIPFTGDMLNMINQANPGYIIDERLMQAAKVQAEHMDSVHNIDHTWADGTKSAERIAATGFIGAAAECTAFGYKDEASVMQGWMNSDPHREIIMGEYNRVGYARKNFYWCLVVGRR